jgi:salicylate hydroxylase
MRVVIIGAGVAGCVMARRLSLLDGVEVVCLERVTRDDHSEAGTGLNVGPNAVKALTALDPELAEAITQASLPGRIGGFR